MFGAHLALDAKRAVTEVWQRQLLSVDVRHYSEDFAHLLLHVTGNDDDIEYDTIKGLGADDLLTHVLPDDCRHPVAVVGLVS